MLENFSGATRLVPVVGDPIAQVKSPGGVTRAFEERGADLLCLPMQVSPVDWAGYIATMRTMKNVDGIIVTVPHKFSAFDVCDTTSDRARFLRSVNTIRRAADGTLHGDMFDGLGFVAACKDNGCNFEGRRALLVGAGGAGTAIAHAVASSSVAELALADLDIARRDDLIARLRAEKFNVVAAKSTDPTGFDIVLNATPLGMRDGDPLPADISKLTSAMFVGDVVTKPEIPPLIAAAQKAGCKTSNGVAMFGRVRDLMVDFLLAPKV
ncbi:MAG: shikimate dehydrogenase [Hyphomicrobiaceae bacterium]